MGGCYGIAMWFWEVVRELLWVTKLQFTH